MKSCICFLFFPKLPMFYGKIYLPRQIQEWNSELGHAEPFSNTCNKIKRAKNGLFIEA